MSTKNRALTKLSPEYLYTQHPEVTHVQVHIGRMWGWVDGQAALEKHRHDERLRMCGHVREIG